MIKDCSVSFSIIKVSQGISQNFPSNSTETFRKIVISIAGIVERDKSLIDFVNQFTIRLANRIFRGS